MGGCDAGKIALYLRSILEEIHMEQDNATTLFEDNNGAIMMANAKKPTKRARHMGILIKYFSLYSIGWSEIYLS